MVKQVSKESLDITKKKIAQLKKLFPEVISEGKIDVEKLQRTLADDVDGKDEKYSFNWAGRKDTFKSIQTTAKGTLVPAEKDSVNWDKTENLFIEGDNLEVLKLLQKAYFEKIKLIYIDPPYNTGKDFIYKDNFKQSIKSYFEQTRQSENGIKLTTNPETSGRYHSDWISMMYPRLFIARNLLRNDGVIIVSIDDNEVHNLRLILNEIFGEENFIADVIWNSTKSVTNTAIVSVAHTHNLVYLKNKEYFVVHRTEFRLPESGKGFSNPDYDLRGPWKADPFQVGGWRPNQQYEVKNPKTGKIYKPNPGCSWKNDYKKFQELLKDNRIVFGVTGEAGPQRKRFLSEATERGKVVTTIWNDVDTTTNATQYLKKMFGFSAFDNPKPVNLIQRFIQLGTVDEGVIMDFFSGSGTTAEAVLQQNIEDGGTRTFICVQLPEPTNKESEARKEGFEKISDIAKKRIRKVISRINKEKNQKFGFKVFELKSSNYRQWENYEGKDITKLSKQMKLFTDPLIKSYKEIDVIYECIIKEGLSPNAKIDKLAIKNNSIYKVSDQDFSFYITLDRDLKMESLNKLYLKKSDVLICLDQALSDSGKTNLAVQCNLKTI